MVEAIEHQLHIFEVQIIAIKVLRYFYSLTIRVSFYIIYSRNFVDISIVYCCPIGIILAFSFQSPTTIAACRRLNINNLRNILNF